MPVKFSELEAAFELISFSGLNERRAFISKETGKIHFNDDAELSGEPDCPSLEDLEDEDKYLEIPGKRDLDLGTNLVMEFAREILPQDYDEISEMFHRRGAYGALKQLLIRRQARDRWHEFQDKATERALREWCKDNLIQLID